MTALSFLKLYAVGAVACFVLDILWLGVVARDFYGRTIGHLMRPDVQWVPAALFYAIYVAAIVTLVVIPALEKRSLGRALAFGALLGLAAYAAYDLTSLALIKDFPLATGIVDLLWGTAMTTTVSAATFLSARWLDLA
jgi:uncharacterized membrane protein